MGESRKALDISSKMYAIMKAHEDAPKEARLDAIWQGQNPDTANKMPQMGTTQSSFVSTPGTTPNVTFQGQGQSQLAMAPMNTTGSEFSMQSLP